MNYVISNSRPAIRPFRLCTAHEMLSQKDKHKYTQNVCRPVMNTGPHIAMSDHSQHKTCFCFQQKMGLTNKKKSHKTDYKLTMESQRKFGTSKVLLCVHLGIIFVNNQLDAQFFLCMFISILYMFQAAMCPSSWELIVSIHLLYVAPYRWPFAVNVWMRLSQTSTTNGHLYRVTYKRCSINTINSPDDGHMCARNM
jgi:hypothetical protein